MNENSKKKKKQVYTPAASVACGLPFSLTGIPVTDELSLIFTARKNAASSWVIYGDKIPTLEEQLLSRLWTIRGQCEFCPDTNALIGVMKSCSHHHQCVFKGSDIRHQQHPEKLQTRHNLISPWSSSFVPLGHRQTIAILSMFTRHFIGIHTISFRARHAFICLSDI